MGISERIEGLIRSFCPLFVMSSPNRKLVVRRCCEIAGHLGLEVVGCDPSGTTWRRDPAQRQERTGDPVEVLDRIIDSGNSPGKRVLYILEDFDLLLKDPDPLLVTKLRRIRDNEATWATVVLLAASRLRLPPTLADLPQVWGGDLEREDLEEILTACEPKLTAEAIARGAEALSGLTAYECENLLALSLACEGDIGFSRLREERNALVAEKAWGLISVSRPLRPTLGDVGGMDLLKAWLRKRGAWFAALGQDQGPRLPAPGGVLLTGPPGCGKSFVAEAVAGSWGLDLVKLDPSRLFSSLVGETEGNLRSVLHTVEALAPVVLCIDEFEKFFPRSRNAGSDGGVLSRVLGIFLRFLQERKKGVFVCATTNHLADLPREIMRAGRFDALFFVDLPTRKERAEILKAIFREFVEARIIPGDDLLDATEHWSGAELRQLVVETLYDTLDRGQAINDFAMLRTARGMVPLAVTLAEEIEAMRQWCAGRTRPASRAERASPRERRDGCLTSRG